MSLLRVWFVELLWPQGDTVSEKLGPALCLLLLLRLVVVAVVARAMLPLLGGLNHLALFDF